MKALVAMVLAALLVPAMSPVVAEEPPRTPEPLSVRTVRFEKIGGGVDRPTGDPVTRAMQPLPETMYMAKDGVYRSALSRISLRVPRIGEELLVDVREAITFVRADGSPATTHIMFDPDGTRAQPGVADAQSVIVVTRLRDDRPKEAETVLAGIDGGEAQRASMASRGITYQPIRTQMGPGLARVIRNRAYTARFPYDIGLLKDGDAVTYGVSAYVIVGSDSMVEFSQLFPCGQRSEPDCRVAALKAHEAFINGVTGFTPYAARRGTPASSAQ